MPSHTTPPSRFESLLPSFALPFVTRALRGGRQRRFLWLSGALSFVSVICALWLALGNGRFEQEVRVAFDLEESQWEQEYRGFLILVHDAAQLRRIETAQAAARNIGASRYSSDTGRHDEIAYAIDGSRYLLELAARTRDHHPDHDRLRLQAGALLPASRMASSNRDDAFPWHDRDEVARLTAIVDARGVPHVALYASPLSVAQAITLLGLLCGGIVTLGLMVFGPLMVAAQQAQEVHENTLPPLQTASLESKRILAGLAAGPLAVVTIFILPHALVFLLCALFVGNLLAAAGALVITTIGGLLLTALAQLLGHGLGRKSSPGMVTIGLLTTFGGMWAVGLATASHFTKEFGGIVAVFPQAAAPWALTQAFSASVTRDALSNPPDVCGTWVAAGAGVLGWSIFAALAGLALSRRLTGEYRPALGRSEALLGACATIFLALLAAPTDVLYTRGNFFFLTSLALVAMPFAVLVAARVPDGDLPPTLRRVSLSRLGLEVAGFGIVHLGLVWLLLDPSRAAGTFHPVALLYVVWCYGVLALLSARMTVVPTRALGGAWIALCGVALIVGFVHIAMWSESPSHSSRQVFALSEASPVLGLIQIVMMALIPALLFRSVRGRFGQVS